LACFFLYKFFFHTAQKTQRYLGLTLIFDHGSYCSNIGVSLSEVFYLPSVSQVVTIEEEAIEQVAIKRLAIERVALSE
jgi:hypothetical protein